MKVRRYYRKGVEYKYTWSDEYFERMLSEKGEKEAFRIDNASYEIILESEEEEREWFFDCLQDVLGNTRWYLDNLDRIPTFKVNIKRIFPEMIKD
jgi:hypothetical protein